MKAKPCFHSISLDAKAIFTFQFLFFPLAFVLIITCCLLLVGVVVVVLFNLVAFDNLFSSEVGTNNSNPLPSFFAPS